MPGQCLSSEAIVNNNAPAAPATAETAKTSPAAAAAPAPVQATAGAAQPTNKMVKLAVIYYSMYGHVKTLAETIKAGAETVPGVEVSIFQVSETLPQEVLTKMYAPPKADYPIIDPHTLPEYDGFIIGFPTRFGMMCAQMKAFFDTTGQLWQKGALVGKAVSFFTATAGQGGGQEVTIMSAVCHAAAHGMVYVPLGYTAGQGQFTLEEAKGGSPWGCGTYAGPTGQRQPSALELAEATQQGKLVAATTIKLAAK